MCGIAGVIRRRKSRGLDIRGVLSMLNHRGPDDCGVLTYSRAAGVDLYPDAPPSAAGADVVLCHRRLSILDLSKSGWQPMASADGRYYIVFNGEIYNYVELKAELEKLGHRFRSTSDTEVLLAAYAEWKTAALPKLVGMFAFAVLDTRDRVLFLARDCFGIKPLYYSCEGGEFAFASEIRALLRLTGTPARLNHRLAFSYLRYAISEAGNESLFANAFQLPPAHFVELQLDDPAAAKPVRYWDCMPTERLDISFEEASRRLRDLFVESVRIHLRSDVPVGTALSGGIDSSSIVAIVRQLNPSADLHTFSFVTENDKIGEEKWADLAGQHARAKMWKIRVKPGELVDDIESLVQAQELPFVSTSIYASYRVFRMAQEAGIKVMLDGQGADECLGGYSYYRGALLASYIRRGHLGSASRLLANSSQWSNSSAAKVIGWAAEYLIPPAAQSPLRRLVGQKLLQDWLQPRWFSAHGVSPISPKYCVESDVLRQTLYRTMTDISLPQLLRYEDRNSMAFSIESRVPFLTPQLTHFLLSLPEEHIVTSRGLSKAVFRSAMRGIVPSEILDRRDKLGYATPEADWLSGAESWVDATLNSDFASSAECFNMDRVRADWNEMKADHKVLKPHIWRCVNFLLWARRFEVSLDGREAATIPSHTEEVLGPEMLRGRA
jgi:asparagine synthase (glutamine-hydrolysing)